MYFGGIAFTRGVTKRPRGEFSFTEYAHWLLPSDTSKNMAAWWRRVNGSAISSTEEEPGDASWNEDEAFENIPLAGHAIAREQDKEEASDAKSEISKSSNSESSRAKKKKVGQKLSWKEDDITDWTAMEFSEENRSVVRKQTCNNGIRLACKRWSIFCRLSFRLLLNSCNNFISRSLHCNFENGAIVFVSSLLTNCHVASVNPEFGATMAQHLNQSHVSAVRQWN